MRDWSIRGPVTLRNYNTGGETTYESAEAFANDWENRRVRSKIGDASNLNNLGPDNTIHWYDAHPYNYLLFDEYDLVVPLWKIEEIFTQYVPPKRCTWFERAYGRPAYRFRYDPVPHVHCFRGGGHWYKHPKTMGEKRAACALENDEDIKEYHIRPRRSVVNVPESYDERQRGDVRTRKNWKKIRKTQWKIT